MSVYWWGRARCHHSPSLLSPPQSAYLEAAVSVQAVAAVHCCYSVRILCCFTVSLASLHCQQSQLAAEQLEVTLGIILDITVFLVIC